MEAWCYGALVPRKYNVSNLGLIAGIQYYAYYIVVNTGINKGTFCKINDRYSPITMIHRPTAHTSSLESIINHNVDNYQ